MTDLRAGWDVLGNDDGRVGTIEVVGQHYIRVSRPGSAADLFVPVSAVANVESEVVHLNMPKDQADHMGWEQEPRVDDVLETGPEDDLHRHV